MNDVYLDGFPITKIKMGKYYYFTLYNPVTKHGFICKTKLKIIDKIGSEIFIGVRGSLEPETNVMINVNKIKIYGVEDE